MSVMRIFLALCLSATSWSANAQPTGDLGWSTLTNRHGASVDFPGGLFTKKVSADAGPMLAFTTADGHSRFELFSIPNMRHESPAQFGHLDSRLIRVVRVRDEASFAAEAGWSPALWLYDAHVDGFGGAGVVAPWSLIAARARRPFLLAGGLTPENVAAAVEAVRPDGVDVASGVELQPKLDQRIAKDPQKVAAFIAAVRGAAI